VPLGVLAASGRGWARRATDGFVVAGISIPDFWLGTMLVLVFAGLLKVLPPAGYRPLTQAPGENLDQARAKLREAGYSNGLTVEYLGLPQYPELLKTGQVVRDQLKAIGITMSIKPVDVSVWFDKFSKKDYQITSAYQERTIDPDNFYSLILKSGAAVNTTGYANPAADKLMDQARSETDQATRKRLYEQLRQIVFDDVPLLFVHYETINYLMRKEILGSTVNPTLELRMANLWHNS
jgi:peptide/nickel transport system substrate-binding protein